MRSLARWTCVFLGTLLLGAPVACSSTPVIDNNPQPDGNDGGSKGSGGSGSNFGQACLELFEADCGRACSNDAPCPDGMHCDGGTCEALCGEGFDCTGGRECTADGQCKDDIDITPPEECVPLSCQELGFECGTAIDNCGHLRDCAEEDGLTCASGMRCQAIPVEDADTGTTAVLNKCVAGGVECEVCDDIPDCSDAAQLTTISGRVVTPGRTDEDTANQIGVPNAIVYILRDSTLDNLPAIDTGIPSDGTSCDRCEDQDLGPVLAGAVSDAKGYFEITSGNIPVGREVKLVVKAGKFRRVTTIEVASACENNALPETVADNPARLPRHMTDGEAVNIPHIAVATGRIDAMECVFHKMGIVADEFTAPAGDGRIHLYRSNGAWPADAAACASCASATDTVSIGAACEGCTGCTGGGGGTCTTCQTDALTACQTDLAFPRLVEDDGRIGEYDLSVLDCEGQDWNLTSGGSSQNIRQYVNRGGRLFASHLSFKWLRGEKDPDAVLLYSEDDPIATSLGEAATWNTDPVSFLNEGTGWVSLDSPNASPRIDNFTEWLENEGVTSEAENYSFEIIQPRSQALTLGAATEEFVHCDDTADGSTGECDALRTQQFSFNTPYGAPEELACGRVAYSGFHVAATEGNLDLRGQVFPSYCVNADANDGVLTDQEKVLLYMLFDLGACVGEPPVAPPCEPSVCEEDACGFHLDGCGGVLDCGDCEDITR